MSHFTRKGTCRCDASRWRCHSSSSTAGGLTAGQGAGVISLVWRPHSVCICALVRLSGHQDTLGSRKGAVCRAEVSVTPLCCCWSHLNVAFGTLPRGLALLACLVPHHSPTAVWPRVGGGKGPGARRQHHHFTGSAGYTLFSVSPRHAISKTAWLWWFSW